MGTRPRIEAGRRRRDQPRPAVEAGVELQSAGADHERDRVDAGAGVTHAEAQLPVTARNLPSDSIDDRQASLVHPQPQAVRPRAAAGCSLDRDPVARLVGQQHGADRLRLAPRVGVRVESDGQRGDAGEGVLAAAHQDLRDRRTALDPHAGVARAARHGEAQHLLAPEVGGGQPESDAEPTGSGRSRRAHGPAADRPSPGRRVPAGPGPPGSRAARPCPTSGRGASDSRPSRSGSPAGGRARRRPESRVTARAGPIRRRES